MISSEEDDKTNFIHQSHFISYFSHETKMNK